MWINETILTHQECGATQSRQILVNFQWKRRKELVHLSPKISLVQLGVDRMDLHFSKIMQSFLMCVGVCACPYGHTGNLEKTLLNTSWNILTPRTFPAAVDHLCAFVSVIVPPLDGSLSHLLHSFIHSLTFSATI